MDLERNQEQLTRWIDGELEGDELREFEKAIAGDPQLHAAKAGAERVRKLLKSGLPSDHDVPNPEFFNSQVQRRIAQESAPAQPLAQTSVTPVAGGILSWFLSPFTLASATAVLVLGIFTLNQLRDEPAAPNHTTITSTYTPDRDIAASHFYSAEADATVILLDGLAAMPDTTELDGQNIVSAGPGSPGELYNEESKLAFVILQGADSVPIVRSFQ